MSVLPPTLGAAVPRIPLRLQPLPQLEPFHQPVLADGKVRYVGEPIAVVLADTPGIAEDALDHIDLEIETLPAITSREQAEASGFGAVRGSRIQRRHHLDRRSRAMPMPLSRQPTMSVAKRSRSSAMRPCSWSRAASSRNGTPSEGKLTVWGAAKTAWYNRRVLAAALELEVEAVDLIEVDVGGGFGSRGEFYPEDFLIPAAARMVGRPVKWTEDRREHMMTANHARDIECDVEIAVSRDGRFLGLRGQVWADIGAYIRTNGSVGPRNVAQYMSGPYSFENIDLKSHDADDQQDAERHLSRARAASRPISSANG